MGWFYDEEYKRSYLAPSWWTFAAETRGIIIINNGWASEYMWRKTKKNYIYRSQPLLKKIALEQLFNGRRNKSNESWPYRSP